MPDFYFRGTLVQYWIWIYAEYQRLFLVYGKEPFEFISPDPKTSPLAQYAPKHSDFVEIRFWEAEHRDLIVRVKANSVLDSDLVNLYVDIYVEPLKKYGESNLSTWKAVQASLEQQGLLIRPTAHLVAKPQEPPKPKTGAELTPLFERHHQKKAAGQKYTLKQIAEETGFTYRYVRQLHSRFLKERKLEEMRKRTNKRTNKN